MTNITIDDGGSPYGGARIKNTYLDRRQDFVAVNKNDLEDILGFDGISALMSSIGMFFLAGATWLFIDKVTAMDKLQMTTTIAACIPSIVFGLIFLGVGFYFYIKKLGRIQRIFDETFEIPAPPPS